MAATSNFTANSINQMENSGLDIGSKKWESEIFRKFKLIIPKFIDPKTITEILESAAISHKGLAEHDIRRAEHYGAANLIIANLFNEKTRLETLNTFTALSGTERKDFLNGIITPLDSRDDLCIIWVLLALHLDPDGKFKSQFNKDEFYNFKKPDCLRKNLILLADFSFKLQYPDQNALSSESSPEKETPKIRAARAAKIVKVWDEFLVKFHAANSLEKMKNLQFWPVCQLIERHMGFTPIEETSTILRAFRHNTFTVLLEMAHKIYDLQQKLASKQNLNTTGSKTTDTKNATHSNETHQAITTTLIRVSSKPSPITTAYVASQQSVANNSTAVIPATAPGHHSSALTFNKRRSLNKVHPNDMYYN